MQALEIFTQRHQRKPKLRSPRGGAANEPRQKEKRVDDSYVGGGREGDGT